MEHSADAVPNSEKVQSHTAFLNAEDDVEAGHMSLTRGLTVLGVSWPSFYTPLAQTIIISVVHLLVVGMFNVLAALGGGGQVDPTTSNNSNTILYALFCIFSLFAGSVTNFLGPKVTLATGGVGYSLLAASYWCYNHTKNQGFVYFAGATCGIAAAFLW